ncbi:MAG: UDP-N-acetylmuramate--L-alanine ligase [Lachnospiraceae bacterium]|jgi:UDP-N-acetylmuramate--alanine ligase|nr:UDP-N-acetylmuramate--L-alanine ligase [Lachnospiraceae bacterium]
MYQLDFKKPINVHFVGIGGISMSGLAQILLNEGFSVSGSDSKSSAMTERLAAAGAIIYEGQKASNITDNIDLAVYTAAIKEDDEELAEIRRRGIPLLTRAQMLGQLMSNYETPIAVSGTHGKTTTTSLVAHILLAAGKDPTVSVGGVLKAINGNIYVGSTGYFVTEACEFHDSFLDLNPKIGIILNIDDDHLDYFKTMDNVYHSFHKFAEGIPYEGTLIINSEIKDLYKVNEDLECRILYYGFDSSNDYGATNIQFDEKACGSFDLVCDGIFRERLSLNVPGLHNVSNALAAIAAADTLGISLEYIKAGLADFDGADRRFQYKGTFNEVTVIDDYAHHPSEIKATLSAAHLYTKNPIWCIFQPHTYSRTELLFNEFVEALSNADHVILPEIYAARESNVHGTSAKQLEEALKERGVDAYFIPLFPDVEKFCKENCKKGDVLITMGAGDVVNIGESLLKG